MPEKADDRSIAFPETKKEFQRIVGGYGELRFAGDPVGKLDRQSVLLPISM
jgi:hypothetical protein